MNGLGMALNRGGQPAKAQAVCARILQIDPNNLAATIAMSLAAAALGDTNQALQWADQAIQLSPASAQTHLAKANALLAGERDAEALDALLEASRYDPKNAGLHLQIGDVLLLNLDRADQALEHYRTACGLNPALVSAQIRLARMLIEQENTGEAKRVLTVIRKLDPANPALAILESQLPRDEQ
jgi:tetratricopeptide (TPR) repeat protein